MSTTETGRRAEDRAANYLDDIGLYVVDRNWRTRWCEIDIVAQGEERIHFVEVKYRSNPSYGRAFEYITADKRARLARAALAWCQAHRYLGAYQIDIISVEGAEGRERLEYLPNAVTD